MHTMQLLPTVAIQPNLELKTRPKQLLGSLPLVIVLPVVSNLSHPKQQLSSSAILQNICVIYANIGVNWDQSYKPF